jgi:hypothetical protein
VGSPVRGSARWSRVISTAASGVGPKSNEKFPSLSMAPDSARSSSRTIAMMRSDHAPGDGSL